MLENISNMKYNRAYEAIYKVSHTRIYPQEGNPNVKLNCLNAFI